MQCCNTLYIILSYQFSIHLVLSAEKFNFLHLWRRSGWKIFLYFFLNNFQWFLWQFHNIRHLDTLLPILSVELPIQKVSNSPAVNAVRHHTHTVSVGTRHVETLDATVLAEHVLSTARVEGIRGKVFLWFRSESEPGAGNYEVVVLFLGTYTAVTSPNFQDGGSTDCELHTTTVTGAVMG